jgi:hypothetical protein
MHAGSTEFYCRYGFHYRPIDEQVPNKSGSKVPICKACQERITAAGERNKRPLDNVRKLDRFGKWVR